MERKLKQYKLIFLFILFTVLILGVYILITEGTRADINLLYKQKELLREENQKLEELIRAEKDVLKQSEEIKVELNRLQESLPAEAKEDEFMNQIKELLVENKMSLKEITPENSLLENEEYQALRYQFKLRGEYKKFLNFLTELEKIDRLVKVNEMFLEDDSEELFIKMGMTIYYKRDDKDV